MEFLVSLQFPASATLSCDICVLCGFSIGFCDFFDDRRYTFEQFQTLRTTMDVSRVKTRFYIHIITRATLGPQEGIERHPSWVAKTYRQKPPKTV